MVTFRRTTCELAPGCLRLALADKLGAKLNLLQLPPTCCQKEYRLTSFVPNHAQIFFDSMEIKSYISCNHVVVKHFNVLRGKNSFIFAKSWFYPSNHYFLALGWCGRRISTCIRTRMNEDKKIQYIHVSILFCDLCRWFRLYLSRSLFRVFVETFARFAWSDQYKPTG